MVGRRLLMLVMLTAAWVATGCEDETDPVDIPFEGVDPTDVADKPKPPPAPTVTTSASAAAKPQTAATGRIQGCCGALYAASKTAKDEGTRSMNKSAASVCSRLAAQVARGQMTQSAALSQVRSSLLGSPPAACR